jgi:phosphoglycolate phosphatase-like HAD superfamily hydrolase
MQWRIVRAYDVDGTLSNSIQQNHRATVEAHNHFGLMPPSLDELRDKYDQSNGFKKYCMAIRVPEQLLPEYLKHWFGFFRAIMKDTPPTIIPGAREELERLASLGAHLILLTKATEKNTDLMLGMAWARSVFNETIFVDGPTDKTDAMKVLKGRMNGDGVIYFGDTLSDGKACLGAGIKFGAMIHEYSYNSEGTLMEFVESSSGMAVPVHGVFDFQDSAERAFR